MSYAPSLLRYPFDYGELRSKNQKLKNLNPQGTCFTMSTLWAKELLERPSRPAREVAVVLKDRIMELAPIHQTYIRETADTLPQHVRNRGYVKVFDYFKVKSPTLRGGPDDYAPGIDTRRDPNADWMGCPDGDMWCVAYKWIMKESNAKHLAVLIGDDKHTVGAFLAKGTTAIRIWDMNAGEFVASGLKQWRDWATAFSAYQGGVEAITLIQLGRKG